MSKSRIPVRDNPCGSCPYRKDTPPGVWSPEEYAKLPAWDDPMAMGAGIFLCHHSNLGDKKMACRGWLEVHCENFGVRLALCTSLSVNERKPTEVPLYRSGAEAARAGLRGVSRPSKTARTMIDKLNKAKQKAAPIEVEPDHD